MAVVGWDLDGVLYNFGASIRRYLDTIEHDFDHTEEPSDWHFYLKWGIAHEQYKKIMQDGIDAGIVFAGPIEPNAAQEFRYLKAAGHKVIIITHRMSPKAQETTMLWLEQHGIPYDEIYFSEDKTRVKTDYFIEDNGANFLALDAVGTRVYLMDRPWNQHIVTDRRVKTIDQFVRKVNYFDSILSHRSG